MSVNAVRPWLLLVFPVLLALALLREKYQPSRGRKGRMSLVLHMGMLLMLTLLLSGLQLRLPSQERVGWLLLDLSDSADRAAVAEKAEEALSHAEDGRRMGVIAYGRQAQVIKSPDTDTETLSLPGNLDGSGSDVGAAVRLAQSLTGDAESGGIAVISDGFVENVDAGDLPPVNALYLSPSEGRDAQVSRVSAPAHVYDGSVYRVEVVVDANASMDGTLVLTLSGQSVAVRDVSLHAGANRYVMEVPASGSGIKTLEARVMAAGDTESRNDTAGAVVHVSGAPSVLLAEGRLEEGREMEALLSSAGFQVTCVAPPQLPDAVAGYQPYQAVVLCNVDRDTMEDPQETALETAVRELGRGLCVIGGDQSLALGGYEGTLLEKMLPVTCRIRNRMDIPNCALVLVIDKSGSMTDGMYGFTRMQMAREAACAALDVLTEQDYAGVIAFDEAGKWVVPLSSVTDRESMKNTIATIRAGGGTAFYTPLAMAYAALDAVEAKQKHVIFLTDGEAGDSGYESIVAQMHEKGITLTSVAIGDGVNTYLLSQLAKLGGGRFYAAGPFDNLPRIFVKETMRLSENYIQNRTFTPVVVDASLTDYPGFPPLHGYLGTTEKPLATVSLASDREDPILAHWQYGSGKVLCWTSDVGGSWSRDWIGWDEAETFFPSLVSFVLASGENKGQLTMEGKTMTLLTEEPLDVDQLTAEVYLPSGDVQTVNFRQQASQHYEAADIPDMAGSYVLRFTGQKDGEETFSYETGISRGWAQEYDVRRERSNALDVLAEKSGGHVTASAEELLHFPVREKQRYTDMRIPLLWMLMVLLLLEVAQKRLPWERLWKAKADSEAPKVKVREKKSEKKKKQEPTSGEITGTLYEQMQHRKRL